MRKLSAVIFVTLAAAGAACSSPSASSSGPAGERAFTAQLPDRVAQTSCPAGSPAGAECFLLRSRGHAAGFGTVTAGPTLDVEVPQSSPACGKRTSFTERLRFTHGSVTAKLTGPRLCLGKVGSVRRHFRVIRGTGAFAATIGRGTATIDVQSVGAVEKWRGRLTAPTG